MKARSENDFLNFGINLAREAGKIIRSYAPLPTLSALKTDFTAVTEADIKVSELVMNRTRQSFPTHGIFGEEQSECQGNESHIWINDPIDGTESLRNGSHNCVFTNSLTINGEVVLGIIYNPFSNDMYWAEKGQGAFLNGTRIEVSQNPQLTLQTVGMVFWPDQISSGYPLAQKLTEDHVHVHNLGSTSQMSALVASGGFAAVVYLNIHLTDLAAASILVTEAGGKFTDLSGDPIEFRYGRTANGAVLSNGLVHSSLLQSIEESGISKETIRV